MKDDKLIAFVFLLPWIGPDSYTSGHQNGFLLECLIDLDRSFREVGGRLLVFSGNPLKVLRHIHQSYPIASLCFQQDDEPIWLDRNIAIQSIIYFLCHYLLSVCWCLRQAVVEAKFGACLVIFKLNYP